MTSYQAESLDCPRVDLRLAILYPAKRYCSVHCDLITVTPSLLEAYDVEFEALSYCWGKGVATNTIFINGKSHQVTPNLEHALRHLRRRDRQRLLWIDAICINQKDVAERNAQVPRMGWIYSNAKEVLIWIGRDSEKEDERRTWHPDVWPRTRDTTGGSPAKTLLAFQFLKNLAWFSEQTLADETHLSVFMKLIDMCKDVDYCANVARLLHREWFERVWVIQEVVLSKKATVICGKQSIAWLALEGASKAMVSTDIMNSVASSHPFFSDISQHRISRLMDCRTKRRIFPLLEATQASKYTNMALHATDARDKLFGLMGMLPVEDLQDIDVNYNISAMNVYRSWVEKRVRRNDSLDVLSLCANTRRRDFPSWVPDLSHRLPQDPALYAITHFISPGAGAPPASTVYDACNSIRAEAHFEMSTVGDREMYELHVNGAEIGTIEFLAPLITQDIVPPTGDIQDILEQLEHMLLFSEPSMKRLQHMLKSSLYDVVKTQLLEEFGTMLFRGHAHANIACSSTKMYNCFRGREVDPDMLVASWPPSQTQQLYANIGSTLRSFLWYSRFFVTSKGDFGVVSDNCNVKLNDELWILAGAKTPVVLREPPRNPSTNGVRVYRELLGPCYVFGHMNGEQIRAVASNDGQERARGVRSSEGLRYELSQGLVLV